VNREEAQRILLAYRPNLPTGRDPEMDDALALAQSDPDLRSWLARQQASHQAIRREMRSIPVPSGLKARILVQDRVVVRLWRRPEFLLAAACFALTLVLAGLWQVKSPKEDLSFAGFRSRMVSFALREYSMDILTPDSVQLREYLRSHGAPGDYRLTQGLSATPLKGGKRLSWQAQPVSMVCFSLPKNGTLYLFVMEESGLHGGNRPGNRPMIEPVKGILTASWAQAGKVYLLAAAAPERAALEKSLPE
jgi:hypothetical protein